jgi:hypothetical protein
MQVHTSRLTTHISISYCIPSIDPISYFYIFSQYGMTKMKVQVSVLQYHIVSAVCVIPYIGYQPYVFYLWGINIERYSTLTRYVIP